MTDTACLDSNVFVYAALYEGEKADGARRLLRDVVGGEREAATASLTLDEVTYILGREETRESALRQAERVLGFANLRVVSVGTEEARDALGAMRDNDALSPRDAFHLAVAEKSDAGVFVTDDDDFDGVGMETVGLAELYENGD
jgi:predicted nucleic acid-binding protein